MIPTYDQFIDPLLRYLAANPDGADASVVFDAMAEQAGLNPDSRRQTLRSGKPVYRSRIQWAHDRLKRAGFSTCSARGAWRLTAEGIRFAQAHKAGLAPELVARLATKSERVRLRPRALPTASASVPLSAAATLEGVLAESVEAATRRLLDEARRAPAVRFHALVRDLLKAKGYSADASAPVVGFDLAGRFSSDRGDCIYVLAKQLQRSVGASRVREFQAAMAGSGAPEGYFFSTSEFNKHAVRVVKNERGIHLVGGDELAALMTRYRVGVDCRVIEIPSVSLDYFSAAPQNEPEEAH